MGEERDCSSVLGLTLQLQKYGIGNVSRNSSVRMLIWGHYDSLLIRKVRKWFDYSPRKDWEQVSGEGGFDHDAVLVNHYPIKLIFPGLEPNEKIPSLFYDEWKDYETLLDKNPCMTVVLLNLTNDYRKHTMPQLLSNFLELLKRECDVNLLANTHCCVLPSLGYSDFCILMADTNWKSALDLVECLHGLTTDDNKAVLSTDYMMPVLYNPKFELADQYFAGSALTVRVHLRPGTTAQQLAIPKDVLAYRPSGGSDCLLQAEKPEAQVKLLQFLLGPIASNVVIDITSTLRLPLKGCTDVVEESSLADGDGKSSKASVRFVAGFITSITNYENKLKQKRRHLRQVNALKELSFNIESICNQPHTGDLRKVMCDLIEDFSDCLDRCTAGMDTKDWPFEEMEYSVGTLCGIIGSFIADLSRSDCFFIERERYNHASVSSATSLLLAYNIWLNDFTDAVRFATGQCSESDHSFLVTSGGQDRTQTLHLFEFLEPDEKDGKICEKVPLITQMSEMSLFDFSGTILRSVHECMHYCGSRLREVRLTHLISFVSAVLARAIAAALFTEKSELEYARSICQALETAEQAEKLEKEVEKLFYECRLDLQKKISGCLMEYLDVNTSYFTNKKDYLKKMCRNGYMTAF